MKHKTRTKALSWLLALAMVLSLLPGVSLTALAADTTWSADRNITDTDTINGGVSITDNITLTIAKDVTLTVNGGIDAGSNTLTVNGAGTLIVKGANGNNGGADYINGYGGGTGAAGIKGNIVVNGANVTIEGGKGGNGGSAEVNGGNGGNGGNGVTGDITVISGSVTITGGAAGNGGGGKTNPGSNGSVGKAVSGTITGDATESADNSNWSDVSGGTSTKQYIQVTVLHAHSFTYTANGAVITATCSAADCPLPPSSVGGTDHVATLTLAAPTTGGGAAVVTTDPAGVFGTLSAVKYQTGSAAETEIPPSDEGFHKASITLGENPNAATAFVTYGVSTVKTDKDYSTETDHGTVTVPAVATVDATVTISTTPAAGYGLNNLTVTKASGGTVDVTIDGNNGTFTMPEENVTVSATFQERSVPVKLSVTQNGAPETCTATLLTDSYDEVDSEYTSKVGEAFVLSIVCDEAYDFAITGSTPIEFSALTNVEKQAYLAKNPAASANTHLFKVTMPAVASGDLTVTVQFKEIKVYTIFYQPTDQSVTNIWCKVGDGDKSVAMQMNADAAMGDKKVFSLNVSMPDDPAKVAFATSDSFTGATMADVTVKKTVADASTWSNGFDGQFLVVSGNAKAVIAAFVTDASKLAVFDNENNTLTGDGTGAIYQIAICGTDENGKVTTPATVKAPAVPDKNGYTVEGWNGFQGSAPAVTEKTYGANDEISISENTIFGAVWNPIQSKVTVNLNGGEGTTEIPDVVYQGIIQALQDPERNGFVFDGWVAGKNVTEDETFFSKSSPFDLNTRITSDLTLNAKWKHVHTYTCVPLSYFGDAMKAYEAYIPHVHVRFCGCGDVKLEAHTFNETGTCTGCGYTKSVAGEAKLDVCFWKDGAASAWMSKPQRTEKVGSEVTVSALSKIGDYQFSKWQVSNNGGRTWNDFTATTFVGFILPCDTQMRAIYVNTITEPQLSLSARSYEVEEQDLLWDSVLFQMEYKLPEGYSYVDAGVKMGDNPGISYYKLKKRQENIIVSMVNGATEFIFSNPLEYTFNKLTEEETPPEYVIEKREDNVLKTMTAATLAEYMYENKPVNIPEYDPIYWVTNPASKGQSGSVNTLTPLRFIQKNNGKHYIYGMAYLTYKTPQGETKTIYTEALPTTRINIPSYTVKATPSGMTNTKS